VDIAFEMIATVRARIRLSQSATGSARLLRLAIDDSWRGYVNLRPKRAMDRTHLRDLEQSGSLRFAESALEL
jgi:hypothetical protein